jgi:hypothetical protein
MSRARRALAGTLLLSGALATAAAPSEELFQASSKAQGAPFDLVVTETQRLPGKSYLQVPGFHERTAAGARWLMCACTALALQRGYSHWFVVYPPAGSEQLVVGLAQSDAADAREVLGSDYVRERLVRESAMPVALMAGFCGLKR